MYSGFGCVIKVVPAKLTTSDERFLNQLFMCHTEYSFNPCLCFCGCCGFFFFFASFFASFFLPPPSVVHNKENLLFLSRLVN